MKISEITQETMLNHIREVKENLDQNDLTLLEAFKEAAIQYCVGQTNLPKEKLELHEDITIAVLVLIADMWDNRDMTGQTGNENRVIENILGQHRTNLLPSPEVV